MFLKSFLEYQAPCGVAPRAGVLINFALQDYFNLECLLQVPTGLDQFKCIWRLYQVKCTWIKFRLFWVYVYVYYFVILLM